MRQIGKVKWFGGETSLGKKQLYGFILRHQDSDIYVHKNQLLCNEEKLRENVIVTFEIGSYRNKEEARKVTLLSLEEDMDTLRELSMHTETWIWKSVFPHYISKLERNDMYPFMLKKLQDLTDQKERDFVLKFVDEEQFLINHVHIAKYAGDDQIKSWCIRLYQSNKEVVSPELKKIFTHALIRTGLNEWESLPLQVYRDNSDILQALSKRNVQYVKCLVKLIEAYPECKEDWISKLYSAMGNAGFLSESLWRLIPVHLVKSELLWSIAPKNIKLPLMDLDNYIKGNEEQLTRWLNEEKDFSDKREFVESIPAHFQKKRPFISYLSPQTQMKLLWDSFLSSPERVWRMFTKTSKVLSLYRIAKEGINLERDVIVRLGEVEHELQIKALLLLLWGKNQTVERKKSVFNRAHQYIQEDIIKQAMNSTGMIRTLRLLPDCYEGLVSYCEGRPWHTVEEIQEGKWRTERAYCSRKRGACEVAPCSTSEQKDSSYFWERHNGYENSWTGDLSVERGEWAQLYSDTGLTWEEWSLYEFLAYCEVTPFVAGLEDSGEYINKLAGWINRLNEIRERLKCSKCRQIMQNNFEYSKIFTAVYRTTIATCREGIPHDHNVYLSHCWGCESIIDSRESPIRVGHYYLCHKCGSGPQGIDYTPGDICPKCGKHHMIHKGVRKFICSACNHTIKASHRSNNIAPKN
ncbi:cold shock domain-containing protein [Bacillus paramobilis]|uniref:Cold shock domain-containing protein n=1 Tax=Bacillus paramobilis TaxID=2817477 RepID=A0ABZ2VKD6_9BACI